MPVMECFSGQFYDAVRNQCISCTAVCPPNRARDNYCRINCPQMHTIEEGIGPKDEPPSFDIKFLLAIIITVAILLLSVIIFISIWIKRRRGRGAVSSVNIEMQPRDQLLSSSSTTEEQGFPQEIRIGGDPEEDAHHPETKFLPSEVH